MEQQVKRRPFSGPALAWRCIFILQDEPAAIYRAQTLRFGYRNVPCVCRFLAIGVSLLFNLAMRCDQQMTTALDMTLRQGDFYPAPVCGG